MRSLQLLHIKLFGNGSRAIPKKEFNFKVGRLNMELIDAIRKDMETEGLIKFQTKAHNGIVNLHPFGFKYEKKDNDKKDGGYNEKRIC